MIKEFTSTTYPGVEGLVSDFLVENVVEVVSLKVHQNLSQTKWFASLNYTTIPTANAANIAFPPGTNAASNTIAELRALYDAEVIAHASDHPYVAYYTTAAGHLDALAADINGKGYTAVTTPAGAVASIVTNLPHTTRTVTFNVDGGTAIEAITVNYGHLATKPDDPTKSNYHLTPGQEWYTDAGKTQLFDFATDTITDNITLYIKWVIDTHLVTYDEQYGEQGGSDVTDEYVAHGSFATEPTAPTKETFTFDGWYTNAGCTEPVGGYVFESTAVNADITLYAKWM